MYAKKKKQSRYFSLKNEEEQICTKSECPWDIAYNCKEDRSMAVWILLIGAISDNGIKRNDRIMIGMDDCRMCYTSISQKARTSLRSVSIAQTGIKTWKIQLEELIFQNLAFCIWQQKYDQYL